MRYNIFGCGYTGQRIALRLSGQVLVFTGSEATARSLRARGLEAQAWNLDRETPADRRTHVANAVVLYLVPPPPDGETDPRLRRCLTASIIRGRNTKRLRISRVYSSSSLRIMLACWQSERQNLSSLL